MRFSPGAKALKLRRISMTIPQELNLFRMLFKVPKFDMDLSKNKVSMLSWSSQVRMATNWGLNPPV